MTEVTPAKRSRGGRCCLLGCGAMFAFGLLLLLAGWFGYRHYGAPWLEARKADLLRRIPAVGQLLQLKDVLAFEGMTISGGEIGSRSAADFPADLWLPHGATSGTFNTTAGSALAALTVGATEPKAIAAQIREQMSELGWRRTPVRDPHDGVALLFEKDGRTARYLIFRSGSGLEIWIRSP